MPTVLKAGRWHIIEEEISHWEDEGEANSPVILYLMNGAKITVDGVAGAGLRRHLGTSSYRLIDLTKIASELRR
jgi:hypothetical protein